MSASAIRAGRAFVELFTKDDALRKGLAAAQARVQAFGKHIDAIGKTFLTAGVAIGAPLLLAAKQFADAGSGLVDMSQRTGIAVEKLSALKFAADQSGTSLEGLEKGLRKMQRTISEAAGGSQSARDALSGLGVSLAQLMDLAPDQQFLTVADALAQIADPTERAAAAMELFGKSGADLLPLVAGGADGIRKLTGEAEKLGLVMSQKDAEAAEKFGDMMDSATKAVKSVVLAVGGALAPTLSQFADDLIANAGDLRQWVDDHQGAIVSLGKLAVALVALSGPLKAISLAMKGLDFTLAFVKGAGAVGTMTTAVGALALALGEAVRQSKDWQAVYRHGTPGERGLQALLTPTATATQMILDKINPPITPYQQSRNLAVENIGRRGIADQLSREEFNRLADEMAAAMERSSPHEALRLLEEAAKKAAERLRETAAAADAAAREAGEPTPGQRAGLEWYLNQDPHPMDEFDRRQLQYRLDDAEAKRREPDLLLAEERDQMLYEWGQDMKEAILELNRDLASNLQRNADTLVAGSEAAAKAFLDNKRGDSPAARAAERQAAAAEEANRKLERIGGLLAGPLPVSCDGHNVGF